MSRRRCSAEMRVDRRDRYGAGCAVRGVLVPIHQSAMQGRRWTALVSAVRSDAEDTVRSEDVSPVTRRNELGTSASVRQERHAFALAGSPASVVKRAPTGCRCHARPDWVVQSRMLSRSGTQSPAARREPLQDRRTATAFVHSRHPTYARLHAATQRLRRVQLKPNS